MTPKTSQKKHLEALKGIYRAAPNRATKTCEWLPDRSGCSATSTDVMNKERNEKHDQTRSGLYAEARLQGRWKNVL